jgi:hypothetical protein
VALYCFHIRKLGIVRAVETNYMYYYTWVVYL